MAINPGSDLLTDALLAAEPQRAKAATDRLANLAASDGTAAAEFDNALAAQPVSAQAAAAQHPLSVTIRSQATVVRKPAHPYQLFEATMLKSFFESMLPNNAKSVFGAGLAGNVWKSMLADSLGTTVSKGKGIGIARELEARARRTKS
jgi:flagellar protein FlgJ